MIDGTVKMLRIEFHRMAMRGIEKYWVINAYALSAALTSRD